MKTPYPISFLVVLALSIELSAMDPSKTASERAAQIAPFLDEQTVLIVRVQMSTLTLESVKKIAPTFPEVQSFLNRIERQLEPIRRCAVREIYYLCSIADAPAHLPLVLIPLSGVQRPEQLRHLFATGRWHVEQQGDMLVAAFGEAQHRIKTITPDPRPHLAEAFQAAGEGDIQVIFTPPRYVRRVIEELLPTLPEMLGGGPSTILTQGIQWAAANIVVAPKVEISFVIQSENSEAAETLRSKWADITGLSWLGKTQRSYFRDFDTVVELFSPRTTGNRLSLTINEQNGTLQGLLGAIALEQIRNQILRHVAVDNLKRLGLAMHMYHDSHNSLPPAATKDAQGKPLLSWRVHILPYIEQQPLYNQFHLDEPWDSPHNRQLIAKMPDVFRSPVSKWAREDGRANYLAVSAESTVFPPDRAISIRDITDGTSNTIMLVEVDDDHAVIWTKPDDLPFNPDNPTRGLGGQFPNGFHAVLCDGSVHFLPLPINWVTLERLLIRNDGSPVQIP